MALSSHSSGNPFFRIVRPGGVYPLPADFLRAESAQATLNAGSSLFLLTRTFFGWLAAADAYPVLDLLATGLAHRNLLHYQVVVSGSTLLPLVAADEILVTPVLVNPTVV